MLISKLIILSNALPWIISYSYHFTVDTMCSCLWNFALYRSFITSDNDAHDREFLMSVKPKSDVYVSFYVYLPLNIRFCWCVTAGMEGNVKLEEILFSVGFTSRVLLAPLLLLMSSAMV